MDGYRAIDLVGLPFTRTVRGYQLSEVVSAMQKAIRRGDARVAGYFAIEMFESGFDQYCWRRLLTVSFGTLDFAGTTDSLTKLMGKGEAQARRELMELHGDAVEVDV